MHPRSKLSRLCLTLTSDTRLSKVIVHVIASHAIGVTTSAGNRSVRTSPASPAKVTTTHTQRPSFTETGAGKHESGAYFDPRSKGGVDSD